MNGDMIENHMVVEDLYIDTGRRCKRCREKINDCTCEETTED